MHPRLRKSKHCFCGHGESIMATQHKLSPTPPRKLLQAQLRPSLQKEVPLNLSET
eukprot:jgi/Botrbrau1/17340/Bobra.0015s0086.1